MINSEDLKPAERIARTVALSHLKRNERPGPNVARVLAVGLLRLMGDLDDDYEVIE